jgi:rieske iron-sulfur protein
MSGRFGRRIILQAGIGLGVGVGEPWLVLGQTDPASVRPKAGDLLVNVDDTSAKPLAPGDVPMDGKQILAWAMDPTDHTVRNGSRLNRVLLLKVDPDSAGVETRGRAADGVVAYTAICTHTGCDVIDWLADERLLYCPCHFSKFDPRDGARVVDGPAPRPLPALPLAVMDGKLVVAKPFTTRVGFEAA